MTPARVAAPAIEPWIEPLVCAPGYLRTSPELAIKGLLSRGVGSCFELAKVFRAGEIGDWHREEFHLLEWYRVAPEPAVAEKNFRQLRADVERMVELAAEAAGGADLGCEVAQPPSSWESLSFAEAWTASTGSTCPEDELGALDAAAETVSGDGGSPLLRPHAHANASDLRPAYEAAGANGLDGLPIAGGFEAFVDQVQVLCAWSELLSWWSDRALDPWLEARAREGVGVHITDFPVPLAALAQLKSGREGVRAQRFESFIGRVELANGYLELRDPREQRLRFARVAGMRAQAGLSQLPVDEAFVGALGDLPPCAGIALGVERLLAWATKAQRLDQLNLELGAPVGQVRG